MKLNRFWAISRKEFLHIIRDPRSLGMAVAIPMILLLLFGYALTLDVDRVPIVVWDQNESEMSREFISRFTGSCYFLLKAQVSNYHDIERAIYSGKAFAALIIPTDFDKRINSGRRVSTQLIVDGSDSNTATITIGYVDTVAFNYSRDLVIRQIKRIGGSLEIREPVDLRPRAWFNADLESKNSIVPGLIAVIMMVIAALLTSLTVAREWERGTMEQLISTPVRGSELILGKLFPYFAIGMFDVLIAVLMGEFLFQVPLRGSAGLLFAMAAIFLAGALSLGIVISILARTQLLASQLAMVVTFLPSFLLSGFVYAIDNMPQAIQVMTYFIPATYFVTILKGIYLKGVGLEVLIMEAVLLTLFGIVMVILANVGFNKKLE